MKKYKGKIAAILLALATVAVTVAAIFGCGSEETEAESTASQVVSVERGDVSIDITAAGNLALAGTEDLAIDLFYSEGTIGEVLVEAGDTVTEGQVLVKLDTEEWDDELAILEDAVITKERDLTQAEANLLTAQQSLVSTQDTTSKEKAIISAEISLQQAEDSVGTNIAAIDYAAAESALRRTKTWYEYVLKRSGTVINTGDYELALDRAKEALDTAQTEYDNALVGYDSDETYLLMKQVEIAKMTLASAQQDLADVAQDIELQEIQVALTEGKLADAQKALTDARDALAEAMEKSPEIKAPFDGFVSMVKVEGGDEVLNGTVAVTVADPNMFEAEILVGEMDIAEVQLGGDAQITVDSMDGTVLPAQITHISPTATISSGVVNYTVEVEVDDAAAGVSLRDGLTVTVSLISQQMTDVLVVPYTSITTENGQSYVQVMTSAGIAERRAVSTGLTDYKYTEVTGGLSEGEQVLIPEAAIGSTETSNQQPSGMMMPGMSGGGPPPGG